MTVALLLVFAAASPLAPAAPLANDVVRPASGAPQTPPMNTVATPVARVDSSPIWSVPLVHTAGLLVGMRLALSIAWPAAYDPLPFDRSGRQFARAYQQAPDFRRGRFILESDGDPWAINVIGHGLFGSEVYGRVRQCGSGALAALAFTAAASAVWEFGVESFNKQPSAIDLVSTPLIGAVLGEARFALQRWLRGRPRSAWRRLGEILIDPLGEAERGVVGTRC